MIRLVSLSLNHSFSICIYIFEDCSLKVPEKNITQIYPEKTDKKGQGKNKSDKPSFQSHDTTMHCSSLNISLKNCDTKNISLIMELLMTKIRTDQCQCSPTFSKPCYKKRQTGVHAILIANTRSMFALLYQSWSYILSSKKSWSFVGGCHLDKPEVRKLSRD